MLNLRNANLLQSLSDSTKGGRGRASLCCFPTLNSVTTASLSLVNVDFTLGNYFFNCKNCVGTTIEVSENSGSTWTAYQRSCEEIQTLAMPSQSAYYRVATSCSTAGVPLENLTSSFSNEIFFVPSGYINYKFTENKANALFEITSGSTDLIYATSSVSSSQLAVPSASLMTSSLTPTEFFITGSTSMSLQITGSNINFYTSSCVATSSIFLGNWKLNPNEFYYITASVSHRPENSCGEITLDWTANSFDDSTKVWYLANPNGTFPGPNYQGASASGSVTGSAFKTNVLSGDCRYNAVYLSGSITVPQYSNQGTKTNACYIAVATGSFTVSGIAASGSTNPWSFTVNANPNSGSIIAPNYTSGTGLTVLNSLVGFKTGVIPVSVNREIILSISGSTFAVNPPFADIGSSLGNFMTISGEGYLRSFGWGPGTAEQQTQYNCIYETTASIA